MRTENPLVGRSGVNFRIRSSGVGSNRLYPLLSGIAGLDVDPSSARAEYDGAVKAVARTVNLMASTKQARFSIGVNETGPGHVGFRPDAAYSRHEASAAGIL